MKAGAASAAVVTARWLAVAALAALGVVAVRSLPLSAVPAVRFPELLVTVGGAPNWDLDAVRRTAIDPVVEAAQRVGGLVGSASTVEPTGATIRLRFERGVDLETKRFALDLALVPLRARLRPALGLTVSSGAEEGGELQAVVWLGSRCDDSTARGFAAALRAVPGVADVSAQGMERDEIWLELDPTARTAESAVETTVRRASAPALPLGELAARAARTRLEIAAGPGANGLSAALLSHLVVPAPSGPLALAALARVAPASAPSSEQLDHNGRPGRALLVWRDPVASPFRLARGLEAALSRHPEGVRPELLFDAAAPLARLLLRLEIAFGIATVLGFAVGWRLGRSGGALAFGAAVPLAIAGALVAFALTRFGLSPATLSMLPLAVGGALVGLFLRWARPTSNGEAWVLLGAGLAVPLALAATGDASPLGAFVEPARGFGVALAGAVAALLLLPLPAPRLVAQSARRAVRALLRERATTLLVAAAVADLLLAFAGGRLTPVAGGPFRSDADLTLEIHRAEGATLAETVAATRRVEEALGHLEGVEETWSRITRLRAQIAVRLDRRHRASTERDLLLTHLRFGLPEGATIAADAAGGSGGGASLLHGGELGHPLHAERDPADIGLLLRADTPADLRRGRDLFIRHLRAAGELPSQFQIGDADPTTRAAITGPASLEGAQDIDTGGLSAATGSVLGVVEPPTDIWLVLHPLRGVPPADVDTAAAAFAQRTAPSRVLPAARPEEPDVRLVPPGVTVEPEQVALRREVVERVLRSPSATLTGASTPRRLFTLEERPVEIRLDHEGGRFVLPVTIHLLQNQRTPASRQAQRVVLDKALRGLALGPRCELVRAPIGQLAYWREVWPVVGAGCLLALFWWALAAARLDSCRAGLVCCAPLVLGAAAAAAALGLSGGVSDELTLTALAAALAVALPCATAAAAAQRRGIMGTYRETARLAPALAGAIVAAALLPALVAVGADLSRESWAGPLFTAAAAAGGAVAGALLLVPPLLSPRRRHTGRVVVDAAAPNVLRARKLTKIYPGGLRALDRVSFELGPGIVGLLGPNGSGKTTLLRLLVGLLEPTRGQVLWRGVALRDQVLADFRRSLGFLPQEFSAYPALTGEQFLAHWARARDLVPAPNELHELLVRVGLDEHAARRVRSYSGGMRRRLGIAAVLIGGPPVLLVDEPTAGLDLASRTVFREILLAAAATRLVLLSTHIASDVEAVASRLLVLRRGKLRFDGSPAQLVAAARGRIEERVLGEDQAGELRELERELRVTAHVRILEGIRIRVVLRPGEAPRGRLVEPNLEEGYLALLDGAADAPR